MAYIDKELLKRNIRVNLMPNVDIDGTVTVENAERYFLNLIDKTSTADVVEVCRCRDCEYWHKKVFDDIYERYVGECHCPQWENDYLWYETTETEFCSNGKRKQE